MSKSKSPRKDGPQPYDADPEARERARKAQAQRSKKKEDICDKYGYHIVIGIVVAVILYSLFSSLWKSGPNILITDVNDEEYITSLNAKGLSFKVGPTPMFEGYKLADAKKLINNLATNKEQLYRCHTGNKDTIVPDTYNFRKAYPSCAREIVTQGNCSSSYTLAAVGMITDRWCRKNELSFPRLSPQTPLACDKVVNSHCKGGFLSRTLDYAKLYGLVEEQCYSYNPVLDAEEECLKKVENCEKFKIADYCVASDMENVKQEIYNYGPVATILTVYRDFLVYKQGLYQIYPKTEKYSSGHAVKIIGWDVKDGQPCWLIENSWGPEWGMEGIGCVQINSAQLQVERFTIAAALENDESITSDQNEMEKNPNTEQQQVIDDVEDL